VTEYQYPRAEQDEPDEATPFRVRVQNLATDASLVVAHAQTRAALRAKEGRPAFHQNTLDALRSIRDDISALIDPDEPADDATPEPAVEPLAAEEAAPAAVVQAQPAPQARFRSPDDWQRYIQERLN